MIEEPEQDEEIRLPEDRLAKVLFGEILGPHGDVQPGRELLPNSLKADVYFQPRRALPLDLPGAGLLARLVGNRLAVIESFSTRPEVNELRSAKAKLYLALLLVSKKRKPGAPHPQACLIVAIPAAARAAERAVFGGGSVRVEKGVRQWNLPDPIYVVRDDKVANRLDTLIFRLMARGIIREVALSQVYGQNIEPYRTTLDDFNRRFRIMAQTQPQALELLDPKEFSNLEEFFDTRDRVLQHLAKAEGKAEAVLVVMELRGLPVTEAQRQQILTCKDLDRLDRWHRRAITASSASEVLDGTGDDRAD